MSRVRRASVERRARAAALRHRIAARAKHLGIREVARRAGTNTESVQCFVRDLERVPLGATLDALEKWLEREPESVEEAWAEWVPSPANIAALPGPVRLYLEALQRRNDPAQLLQEVVCRRRQVAGLTWVIGRIRKESGRDRWYHKRLGEIAALWPAAGDMSTPATPLRPQSTPR